MVPDLMIEAYPFRKGVILGGAAGAYTEDVAVVCFHRSASSSFGAAGCKAHSDDVVSPATRQAWNSQPTVGPPIHTYIYIERMRHELLRASSPYFRQPFPLLSAIKDATNKSLAHMCICAKM